MSYLLGLSLRLPRPGRLICLLACAGGLLLATTGVAQAFTWTPAKVGTGYEQQTLRDARGNTWSCYGEWSSGTDGAGSHYTPCDSQILVVDRNAKLTAAINLPSSGRSRRDVAATWDGTYVYYIVSPVQVDCIKASTINSYGTDIGSLRRAVRQSNGTYLYDSTWRIAPVDFHDTCDGAATKWGYRGIDVDRAGNIYATADGYVFVYAPNGALIDSFGGDAANPYNNGLTLSQGISVTPDGNSVYVVEQRYNFLQRWDRQLNGTWVRSNFAIGHAYLDGQPAENNVNCIDPGWLASPYDVDLDGAGNIYLLDVSCFRLLKFTSGGGYLGTVWSRMPVGGNQPNSHHLHGFSVDFHGTFLMADPESMQTAPNDTRPEPNKRYARVAADTASDRLCLPDWDAPVVTSFTGPARANNPVAVKISAADACSAIESMKLTGEYVGNHDWQPFNGAPSVTLGGAKGPKLLTVRVRDHWGRVSDPVNLTITLDTGIPAVITPPTPSTPSTPATPPPTRAKQTIRSVISIYGPWKLCTPRPITKFAKAAVKTLRIADSCARMRGKLLSSRKIKSGRILKVQLSLATTRLLYRNATRPVTIQVAGTRLTKSWRRLRNGHNVTFTGAIVVARDKSWITIAPAGSWIGS
jgi:DNA-binding beta-propeller fold protein YncE